MERLRGRVIRGTLCHSLGGLLVMGLIACDDRVTKGDGRYVDRVVLAFMPGGDELTLVLTDSVRLGSVVDDRLPKGLRPGMSEDEATAILGPPIAIVHDEKGDSWARWPLEDGVLEIGRP